LAGPGAQQVGGGLSECFHVPEVEFCGAGNCADGPGLAAVRGSSECALGATDPGNFCGRGTKSAKVSMGTDGLLSPLGANARIAEPEKYRGNGPKFHCGSLITGTRGSYVTACLDVNGAAAWPSRKGKPARRVLVQAPCFSKILQ